MFEMHDRIGSKHRDPAAHAAYIEALKRMGPERRLQKAFELSELTKRLFVAGLRERHPDLSPEDFAELLRERMALCHNRNY